MHPKSRLSIDMQAVQATRRIGFHSFAVTGVQISRFAVQSVLKRQGWTEILNERRDPGWLSWIILGSAQAVIAANPAL